MELDYAMIGARVREQRKKLHLTQEELAEIVDVGTTHISHIETGNTIPSMKLFVDLANALHTSADALLCDHLQEASPVFADTLLHELQDCNRGEIQIVTEVALSVKASLRKYQTTFNP
jgi:transcriptional regulator with XRE-family HTH domain